jgi:hypothetical protein
MSETLTFQQTFHANIMKSVIKFTGTAVDSKETMYLNIKRFKDIKIEEGKVVKVTLTVETGESSS